MLWACRPSPAEKLLSTFWVTSEGFVCLIRIWHYFCHSLDWQCPCSDWGPSSVIYKGSCYVNKSYIRNNLPPAVHNNAAAMPSRHCADSRNRPCEVWVPCFPPQASQRGWSRSCAPLRPGLPSQEPQHGRHGHAALQQGALRLPAPSPHSLRLGTGITPALHTPGCLGASQLQPGGYNPSLGMEQS